MYYSGNVRKLLKNNTAIVGKRESGKTTILKKLIKHCYENDYTILLFDSATDHADKSLLIDTVNKYKNTLIISSPPKELIEFGSIHTDSYPRNTVAKTHYNIYAFDVSKYLEEGYETEDLVKREEIRNYYKRLVVQELVVMLPVVVRKRAVVIMDEIEFLPIIKRIVPRYSLLDIPIIAAMHDEKNLSTASMFFDVITLD